MMTLKSGVLAAACALYASSSLFLAARGTNFTLVQDYSGNGFFDSWVFYGNYDNLTNGAYSLLLYLCIFREREFMSLFVRMCS